MKIKTDSRKVKPGDTFIAIKNVNTDGHDFIESAIKMVPLELYAKRVVMMLKPL